MLFVCLFVSFSFFLGGGGGGGAGCWEESGENNRVRVCSFIA